MKVGTEFSNVWGEYKNHSNPYIRGTTVPCDRVLPYPVIFITINLGLQSLSTQSPGILLVAINHFALILIRGKKDSSGAKTTAVNISLSEDVWENIFVGTKVRKGEILFKTFCLTQVCRL